MGEKIEELLKKIPVGGVSTPAQRGLPLRTGLWRTLKPVIDKDACRRCGTCWMYCPDDAIKKTEEGFYEVDYEYCKGCGVCSEECPFGAIKMVREE
jgi:pyruvate ferredoxin oxidoreductase delta subunit